MATPRTIGLISSKLMTSHDGGVSIISRSWNGNASDSKIFRERSSALLKSFKNSKTPRYLIADSKLYSKETIAGPLKGIPFITRVPSTIKEEQTVITKALNTPIRDWTKIDESNRYFPIQINHYEQAQRWIVVSSDAIRERSKKSTEKSASREEEALKKELSRIEKREFACQKDAENSLSLIKKRTNTICEK